jgi:hypothetical protein
MNQKILWGKGREFRTEEQGILNGKVNGTGIYNRRTGTDE